MPKVTPRKQHHTAIQEILSESFLEVLYSSNAQISNLSDSHLINDYFFDLNQLLVAKFKAYNNIAIAVNLSMYISDFLEWLKEKMVGILKESHNKEEFICQIQEFTKINQEIANANQFIKIINDEFPGNSKKIANLLTTVLNENLLLQRQGTLMTCFVEERRPPYPAIKINISSTKIKNAIDHSPTRIKPDTSEFGKVLCTFFQGSLENDQFIFKLPLTFKLTMLFELERGYHIKYKDSVYNVKNLLVKVDGKINIEASSAQIVSFFNAAGIGNPNVIAYLICAMAQGGIDGKSANLTHISTKEILNKESDFLIGGRNSNITLELQEDGKSILSFLKEGKLTFADKETVQTSENPKAKIFHSFEIKYTDDGKMTDILPCKNFLFCPIVNDTRNILQEAIILADPDGSIEYVFNLNDPQQEETVSRFVDHLKKDASNTKPFLSTPVKPVSFNDYLNNVWDLQKPGDSGIKTYGEISVGNANRVSATMDGQITRMFNDFPAPEGIMEAMTSIIKPALEKLLKEKNINNKNHNFADILTDKDFLAIWNKVFIRVIFPWVLDPFTGKLKSNIKALLEEKYGDTYIRWATHFSEEKLAENFICSFFVGPLVYTSYCDAPTNFASVLGSFSYNAINHNTNGSIPYTGGNFDQQLLTKFTSTSIIKDEIKKWSDQYKLFMDCTKEPHKILQAVESFDLVVEEQYDKLWRSFHHSLVELKSTQLVFSGKASKMFEILDNVIHKISDFNLTDVESVLLFKLLAHYKKFKSNTLFNNINLTELKAGEQVDSQKALNTFVDLYKKIDGNTDNCFYDFSYSCTWITENYAALLSLIEKLCITDTAMFKNMHNYLEAPMQRLTKLPLFSKEWKKVLEKIDQEESAIALTMANTLDNKFNDVCKAMEEAANSAKDKQQSKDAFFDNKKTRSLILESCSSKDQIKLSGVEDDWSDWKSETSSSESDDGSYSDECEILEEDQKLPKIKFIFGDVQDKLSRCYCLFNLLKKECQDAGDNFLLIDKKDMPGFEVLLLKKAEEVNDLFAESFPQYLIRVLDAKKQTQYHNSSLFSPLSSTDLTFNLFKNCPSHLSIINKLAPVIKEKLNTINSDDQYSKDREIQKIWLSIFRLLFNEMLDPFTGELKPEIVEILKEKYPQYNSCANSLGKEGFKSAFFQAYALEIVEELTLHINNDDIGFFDGVKFYFDRFSDTPKIKNLIQSWTDLNKEKSAITSIECINGYVKSFSFEEKGLDTTMLLEAVHNFMKAGCSIELKYDTTKNKKDEDKKVECFFEAAKNSLEVKQIVVKNILSGKPPSLFDQEIIRRVATTPEGKFNDYIMASNEIDKESKILCICYLSLTRLNWNEEVFECIKAIGKIDDYILHAAFQLEITQGEKNGLFTNMILSWASSPDNQNYETARKIIANTPKPLTDKLVRQKADEGLQNDVKIIISIYQENLLNLSQKMV